MKFAVDVTPLVLPHCTGCLFQLAFQVMKKLCTMAFDGPVAFSPSVMRAACALLPANAMPAFISRLSEAANASLARRACDAESVNAAHVMIQLMRDAPATVADSAVHLVEWIMDDLLQSPAIHAAGKQGCLEQMLDLSVRPGFLHAQPVTMKQNLLWAQRNHRTPTISYV